MANEPEEGRFHEDEEEGGPVKSFLEHLEDLRWMLIKSAAAIAIAVVVCLLAGNYVVKVLLWPLQRAKTQYPSEVQQLVTVYFQTNKLGVFQFNEAQKKALGLSTNRFFIAQVQPTTISVGTNTLNVLSWSEDKTRDPEYEAEHMNTTIANLSPAEAFMTAFHVALYAGIAIASPFVFFFISSFVFPALKMNEKKYIYRGLAFGFGLFLIGVCFCYFVLMPVALAASQAYSSWLGFTSTVWKADEYIGFVSKFMLGMGLGFEMPVVILVLVKLGILNYNILKKARPYMIVINFVLGAVLTTPEVVTQVLMALPLQLLFEISVWVAWYWERQERKKEEAAAGIIDAH
jgi:sec-independent protein translocase protein TatC